MSEQWWTPEDEERVAAAMCKADTVSWKNDIENGTTTLADSEWNDMGDETVMVPYEGISLGRDHYRTLAPAALAVMPVPAGDPPIGYTSESEYLRSCIKRLQETLRTVDSLNAQRIGVINDLEQECWRLERELAKAGAE